jgi:hypothetical protein
MTAPLSVLSPSSILPPPSHYAYIPSRKEFGVILKILLLQMFKFFKNLHASEIA